MWNILSSFMYMLTPDYNALWQSMVIASAQDKAAQLAAQHIHQFLDRYEQVGISTCITSPVPWYFIGVIHHMESGQNFNRHLYNGDPLSGRTVHVPVGRPIKGTPPFTWDYSAQCALLDMGYGSAMTWEIDHVLLRLEAYNGMGYRKHDIYTPYIWSGTNHYSKGKYISDGTFDPNNVSNQLGCAAILKYLI